VRCFVCQPLAEACDASARRRKASLNQAGVEKLKNETKYTEDLRLEKILVAEPIMRRMISSRVALIARDSTLMTRHTPGLRHQARPSFIKAKALGG